MSARMRRSAVRRAVAMLALVAAGGGVAAASAAEGTGAGAGSAAAAPRTVPVASASGPRTGDCAAGELCLWERGGFVEQRWTYELTDVNLESCVPLPEGETAASFGNRTGRPVTVYQSRECAETGDFSTYPNGSWAPRSEYQVRAFKIWEK